MLSAHRIAFFPIVCCNLSFPFPWFFIAPSDPPTRKISKFDTIELGYVCPGSMMYNRNLYDSCIYWRLICSVPPQLTQTRQVPVVRLLLLSLLPSSIVDMMNLRQKVSSTIVQWRPLCSYLRTHALRDLRPIGVHTQGQSSTSLYMSDAHCIYHIRQYARSRTCGRGEDYISSSSSSSSSSEITILHTRISKSCGLSLNYRVGV